jgi:hypothetical protein
VYPLSVAVFVLLRRYSVYEGRRLDAIAWNDAREKYMNGVFEQAARPLAVLAATYRFSSDANEDAFDKLLDGSVRLEPQTAPKSDSPPVNARWFEEPDSDDDHKRFKSDNERQRHVLAWAFGAVLDEIAGVVRSLPLDLKMAVQLVLPGIENTNEALAAWNKQWEKLNLRPLEATVLTTPPDLMSFDTWLDRVDRELDQEVRLFACVRLNPIYEALPPDGSAESAVAILVAPEDVLSKLVLAPLAMLHRPNGTDECPAEIALARALRWGRLEPAEVNRIWQCGLDATTTKAVTAAVVKAGIDAKPANIDYMIGHAGEAVPWLGVTCAAKVASHDGAAQLVVVGSKKGACFAVLRNINAQ